MKYLNTLFLLFISLPAFAEPLSHPYLNELINQARAQNLGSQRQWQTLLHYKEKFFGGYESQADGMKFFLSPDGKTNPAAELEADLKAFFAPVPTEKDSQQAQCQFPARYRWLKSKLKFDPAKLSEQKCARFEKFRDNIQAKSVTIVFSAYYLNNPASAFGHSFLRLNKSAAAYAGKRYELLDYGISYAASVTIGNPIIYAVYGIFGMFPGQFTSIPYYYKVREYNDYETRDLWEYDLNLTEEQTAMTVAHIWELGSTYFDYFYLSENCSYHALSILEAGNPDLHLTDKLPWIVVPADTMRVLVNTPGLVSKIQYRPAGRVGFSKRVEKLNANQAAALRSIIASNGKPSARPVAWDTFSATEKAEVLDSATDYIDYKFSKDVIDPETAASHWKQTLLSERSQIPVVSTDVKIDAPLNEMPHLGHDSARVGLDYGYSSNTKDLTRLSFRFALHDLLDPMAGYPEFAQIEFLTTRLRYNYQPKTFWVEDFNLLKVVSLSPLTAYTTPLSWKLNVGARTIRDRSCSNCLAGDLGAGAGYAFQLYKNSPLTFISMLDVDLAGAPSFDRSFIHPALGPNLGLRMVFNDHLVAIVHGNYRYQFGTAFNHYYEYGIEARAGILRNLSVNLKAIRYPDLPNVYGEYSAGAMYYF